MNIQEALQAVQRGEAVRRVAWPHTDSYLRRIIKSPCINRRAPSLFIQQSNGLSVPWVVCHDDILSDDWVTISIG